MNGLLLGSGSFFILPASRSVFTFDDQSAQSNLMNVASKKYLTTLHHTR
jgi:hypothetical protein